MGRCAVSADTVNNNIQTIRTGEGRTLLNIDQTRRQTGANMKGQGIVWLAKALPEIVIHHCFGAANTFLCRLANQHQCA